eukprot:4396904-Pyramimonas_sp.AAC.1
MFTSFVVPLYPWKGSGPLRPRMETNRRRMHGEAQLQAAGPFKLGCAARATQAVFHALCAWTPCASHALWRSGTQCGAS